MYDGTMTWLKPQEVSGKTEYYPANFKKVSWDIGTYAKKEVMVVLECSAGGPGGNWYYEQAYIDNFNIE